MTNLLILEYTPTFLKQLSLWHQFGYDVNMLCTLIFLLLSIFVSTLINNNNKQIPWGIYVPRLIFIWGVKNGKVNQRTTGPVSNT